MYNLRGRPVQFRRNACSISPVKVFSIKRSGCSTPPEYSPGDGYVWSEQDIYEQMRKIISKYE